MITYILLASFFAIILIITYYTFFLLKNSGGSLLYQRISGLGLLFILISIFSFTTISQHYFDIVALNYNFSLYSMSLQILVTYNLFTIWEIRHNQIAKTKYKSVMIILTLINLILLFIKDQINITGIDKNIINNLPIILNVVLLTNISLLFLRFNKLSSSIEFRFFPILIFLVSLLSVFIILYNLQILSLSGYFLSLLGHSITYLLLMQFCISDFKKSFYYYKKI